MDMAPYFLISPIIAGVIGLIIAVILYFRVKAQPSGNETMNRIAGYIREGSMAFLVREYKVLAVYCIVVAAALFYALGMSSAIWFTLGAFLSLFAGFVGMKAATFANVRTTQAAATSTKGNALLVALDGGAVMGLWGAGLGLIGLGALFYFFQSAKGL
ncbi:MAG: sodium/proton-translocating pyrophosphatase [Moraxellaceae bacterium]|nr:sodium/proton-translocating pyrophosphatase [Pseudobdellovibrionaceae bacterium]